MITTTPSLGREAQRRREATRRAVWAAVPILGTAMQPNGAPVAPHVIARTTGLPVSVVRPILARLYRDRIVGRNGAVGRNATDAAPGRYSRSPHHTYVDGRCAAYAHGYGKGCEHDNGHDGPHGAAGLLPMTMWTEPKR